MRRILIPRLGRRVSPSVIRATALLLLLGLVLAAPTYAQTSPWETAVTTLQTAFTGTIAKALSLIAIVIGGITFAFSEGGSKRLVAGIVFGVGMAIGAAKFLNWLFPGGGSTGIPV